MPPATDFSATPAPATALQRPAVRAAGTPIGWPLLAGLRWLFALSVLLVLLAALAVQQWAARDAQIRQLDRHDMDSAKWLAVALGAEAVRSLAQREALLGAYAASARVARVQWRDLEGRVVWQRGTDPRTVWAPELYRNLLALQPAGASAAVRSNADGLPAGSVLVQGQTADVADSLWQGLIESALVLTLLGGLIVAGAAWRVRLMRRALAEAVQQASALADGRYLRMAPNSLPELRPLAASMNLLVDRLQAIFDTQAAQLEVWRRQAHTDALTGLPVRRHFLAQFEQLLAGDAMPAQLGLLLLRVRDLQGMNRRIGHSSADQVLQAVAHALETYPHRATGCFVGRLNGADFAMVLPIGGLAEETAHALVQALRLPVIGLDAAAGVSIGAVELRDAVTVQQALALADEALARAETSVSFSSACIQDPGGRPDVAGSDRPASPYGETMWHQRLSLALEQGRVELGNFPVCTADGRVLHLDCPMRVQLEPGGSYEPAARWLPQAARARLCAEVDERAVQLALEAIEEDGQARCINMAAQSMGVSDFMAAISRRLEAAPQAATRLWIDLPESLALDRPALVQEAARRWRPLGVYIGLEHAGDGLARIPRMLDLGLDCVRIDARYLQGLSAPQAADMRRYLRGLVQLVQSVGLSITAEGVTNEADLALLWSLGFDAATGPVVKPEPVFA
jgi:diguanylate cyclase (GGDEF)-like protein